MIIMEKLIFEKSKKGRRGYRLPTLDVPEVKPEKLLGANNLRDNINIPEISELETVRHFVRLSQQNYSIDTGFYPLGSCTMKFNPKVNEDIARFSGYTSLHPHLPDELTRGSLRLMYELGEAFLSIFRMDAITLQPSAGAHGELVGMLITRAYHRDKGRNPENILIPDSAHGTNPASASLAGFKTIEIPSNNKGRIDLKILKEHINENTAGMMVTNPNTLGLYEYDMPEIAELLHSIDALLYYDGANANAILGKVTPQDMGCDIVHLNLHKTFSTPHGGGGPGAGPVLVVEKLKDFLPVPVVKKKDNSYYLDYNLPKSIGRVQAYSGNFLVLVKAFAYILYMGDEGLKNVSEDAVLNANYLRKRISEFINIPYNYTCMHEFVASGEEIKEQTGVKTLDIAKRLIDYGFHPPTIYFPLIVNEALMIEPTETETIETLDLFTRALRDIIQEAKENPELLKNAPSTTPIGRLDEVKAIKNLDLVYDG
jgi:glycine dehydrogenase subunit 2